MPCRLDMKRRFCTRHTLRKSHLFLPTRYLKQSLPYLNLPFNSPPHIPDNPSSPDNPDILYNFYNSHIRECTTPPLHPRPRLSIRSFPYLTPRIPATFTDLARYTRLTLLASLAIFTILAPERTPSHSAICWIQQA